MRSIAKAMGSQSLAQVPVLTVEQPAAITAQVAAAVDVVGITVQPFFAAVVDTMQDG